MACSVLCTDKPVPFWIERNMYSLLQVLSNYSSPSHLVSSSFSTCLIPTQVTDKLLQLHTRGGNIEVLQFKHREICIAPFSFKSLKKNPHPPLKFRLAAHNLEQKIEHKVNISVVCQFCDVISTNHETGAMWLSG